MTNDSRRCARGLVAALLSGLACAGANAAIQVIGVQYQQDNPYTEFQCIWHDRNYPTSCGSVVGGGNVHVYLKNTGASFVTINDVTLAGYSLATVVKMNTSIDNLSSIYFYWDNPPQDIINAGEPVWYKGDPSTIPAGGVGQAVIRLRYVPTTATVSVGVVTSGGTATTNITVDANAPQLASIGYSSDRMKVYLHWRRNGGAAPTSIWMDGINVTANTTTVGDTNVNFAASVISLATPFTLMSYHVYQGVYGDGQVASASQRAWVNKFIYSTYGVFTSLTASEWISEASDHGVNNCQLGGLGMYPNSGAGQADMEVHGFGYTSQDIGHLYPQDPDMWFLNDEPDAEEENQAETHCGTGLLIPCGSGHHTGTLCMSEISHGETLRASRPLTPTTVNMDGTLKPDNYYAWGQAVDILQVDPYYQRRLQDTYWYNNPAWIPLYKKATYIYAVSRAVCAAAEPNPSNVLLFSCEYRDPNTGDIWPFPTPESKRIEVYYALAGGARGIGYWWMAASYPFNGLDARTPTALALWKEMGLLGNEIKTARPLLVTAHPVDMLLTPGTNVWARALASGTDTIILLVVNDNYYNDIAGCHYTPVANATVTATLPSWMQSPTAFEISASGLSDVGTQFNGNQLQVNLGTLKLTRMIVVTRDPQLRATIQARYVSEVWPGICNMAPELCTPQTSPPVITQQPANANAGAGDTIGFTIVAGGSDPLSYQWQKNNNNIANGGHYSGCATSTLTVTGADSSDAASYRCVVTNAYGTNISNPAMLTVTNSSNPPIILVEPANQTVVSGGNCNFTIAAAGANPLRYQWQKNNADLSNGGHYSGCTTNALTVAGADNNDAASYRCVVTNTYGTNISTAATLTVVPGCVSVSLANGNFEGANTGGIADGWTGYQRAPNPTTVWTIQTNSPPAGGGLQYQQIANTSSTGGGGVRQNVNGCVAGATYKISGWMRGNSLLYSTCTVKVSPTASTDSSTAIHLNPPQIVTGNYWTNFSGTVVASGTSMTLWLDGQTGSTGLNKAECFDSVTVACVSPLPPLQFTAADLLAGNQVRLTLSGPIGGSVTILRSSNLVNWVELTNLVNTSGTVEFADTTISNSPQQFYRARTP